MKKLIFGLLIVAAGTGAFLLLRKKKNTTAVINKDWIIGQWNPVANGSDTVLTSDSNFLKYQFDFRTDGNIIRSFNDSVKADTTRFVWSREGELVWSSWTPFEKENTGDSTAKTFDVTKLTHDSLQIRSVDSSTVLFIKTK
jgi:hypothetical protein